jgi:hypothetical protein
MKFVVPYAEGRAEAEQVWAGVRLWLSELGLATTRRRIEALALRIGDRDHKLAVGRKTPDGELVMAILESSDLDLFYLCTPTRGVLDDNPHPLALDEGWRVIDFDEEAVGYA